MVHLFADELLIRPMQKAQQNLPQKCSPVNSHRYALHFGDHKDWEPNCTHTRAGAQSFLMMI
jgi:hypothetical protein